MSSSQSEYIQALENTLRQREINITTLNRTVQQTNAALLRQDAEIEAFEVVREIARQKYGENWHQAREEEEPWHTTFTNGSIPKKFEYKTACQQNNMSTFRVPHHGLEYVEPGEQERVLGPEDSICYNNRKVFDFPRLLKEAPHIVSKIAKYTMVSDRVIHFIARLDPCSPYPPEEGCIETQTRLPIRWFFGVKICAINSSPRYLDVLNPILVCREWHEIFATAFYALNTFSFQSVGEFGIFCKRTWSGKLERIQNITQIWLGSKMRMGPKWCRARYALHKLGKMKRLKRYEMILNESENLYVRRNKEPEIYRKTLATTKNHENSRKFRDLRKMRGIDNLYQVRGLHHIAVYDYHQGYCHEVRDQGFVKDLRYQVCAPKNAKGLRLAEVRNLKPLLRRPKGQPQWTASTQVRWIIENFYNPDIPYSAGYMWPGPDPDQDEDSDDEDDEAGDDEDESDGDDDDHGNSSLNRQRRYSQRTDEGYGSQETSPRRASTSISQASSSSGGPAPSRLRPGFGRMGDVYRARLFAFRRNRHAAMVENDHEEDGDEDVPMPFSNSMDHEEDGDEDVPMPSSNSMDHEDSDEDVPMPSSNSNNDPPTHPVNDSGDVEFLSQKLPPVVIDLLNQANEVEECEVEFLNSVKRPLKVIDLTDVLNAEECDMLLPSVEEEEVKAEDGMKDEEENDSKAPGSYEANSSHFVAQSRASTIRSVSRRRSWGYGDIKSQTPERKRTLKNSEACSSPYVTRDVCNSPTDSEAHAKRRRTAP